MGKIASQSFTLVSICVLNFLIELSSAAVVPPIPILQIKQGKVKGSVGQTRDGRHYAQFLGIPFAGKPERFQLAGPAPKWENIKEASNYGSRCIQYRRELKEIVGSEDCLFLNVYTPEFPKDNVIQAKAPLPVLVFIHGGSFLFYSGEVFGPKYLLDEDVILVTFNYRLGALGFLNTEDRSIVPNLGLKDQVAALKWVQENIASFGGDPKRVTLFGNSAGSASVSYHVLSPLSKNLFSGAISQSGTALCPWAFIQNPGKVVKNLGEKLKCPTTTNKELVACLKTKDLKEIIEQQQKILGTLSADPPVPFAPSAENTFLQTRTESSDDFLPDSPSNLLSEGKFNRVPYIIGVNSADGLTFAAASILNNSRLVDQIDKNWDIIAPVILAFGATSAQPKEVAQKVREYYYAKDKITADNLAHIQKFTELVSDRNFFQCTQNTAVEFAKHGSAYIYYFTQENGASFLDHFGTTTAQDVKGVKHQDEIQYLTSSPYFPEIKTNSKTLPFSKAMVKLWASFAADGKPSKTWGKQLTWAPLTPEEVKPANVNANKLKWYNIDDDTKLIEVPFTARVKFWNELPITLKKTPISEATSGSTQKPLSQSQSPDGPKRSGAPTFAQVAAGSTVKPLSLSVGNTPKPPVPPRPDFGVKKVETSTSSAKDSSSVSVSPTTTESTTAKSTKKKTETSSFSHVFPDHDEPNGGSSKGSTVTPSPSTPTLKPLTAVSGSGSSLPPASPTPTSGGGSSGSSGSSIATGSSTESSATGSSTTKAGFLSKLFG